MKVNGFKKNSAIVFFCFFVFQMSAFVIETGAQSAEKRATPQQIRFIVNGINKIESLPVKKGEPIGDKYAEAIVELGELAAPYLIEKLTDRRDSRFAYFFQYKIGDVARSLLDLIYEYPDYPFPDGSKSMTAKRGNYQDYVEFFGKSKNRKQLQKSWKQYVKSRTAGKDIN